MPSPLSIPVQKTKGSYSTDEGLQEPSPTEENRLIEQEIAETRRKTEALIEKLEEPLTNQISRLKKQKIELINGRRTLYKKIHAIELSKNIVNAFLGSLRSQDREELDSLFNQEGFRKVNSLALQALLPKEKVSLEKLNKKQIQEQLNKVISDIVAGILSKKSYGKTSKTGQQESFLKLISDIISKSLPPEILNNSNKEEIQKELAQFCAVICNKIRIEVIKNIDLTLFQKDKTFFGKLSKDEGQKILDKIEILDNIVLKSLPPKVQESLQKLSSEKRKEKLEEILSKKHIENLDCSIEIRAGILQKCEQRLPHIREEAGRSLEAVISELENLLKVAKDDHTRWLFQNAMLDLHYPHLDKSKPEQKGAHRDESKKRQEISCLKHEVNAWKEIPYSAEHLKRMVMAHEGPINEYNRAIRINSIRMKSLESFKNTQINFSDLTPRSIEKVAPKETQDKVKPRGRLGRSNSSMDVLRKLREITKSPPCRGRNITKQETSRDRRSNSSAASTRSNLQQYRFPNRDNSRLALSKAKSVRNLHTSSRDKYPRVVSPSRRRPLSPLYRKTMKIDSSFDTKE